MSRSPGAGKRHISAPFCTLTQALDAAVFALSIPPLTGVFEPAAYLSGGVTPSPLRTRKTCLSNRKRAAMLARWWVQLRSGSEWPW